MTEPTFLMSTLSEAFKRHKGKLNLESTCRYEAEKRHAHVPASLCCSKSSVSTPNSEAARESHPVGHSVWRLEEVSSP